jgi:hypothetical protein
VERLISPILPVSEKSLMLEPSIYKESLVTKSNQSMLKFITKVNCGMVTASH